VLGLIEQLTAWYFLGLSIRRQAFVSFSKFFCPQNFFFPAWLDCLSGFTSASPMFIPRCGALYVPVENVRQTPPHMGNLR
jgi:hypothetical protein